MSIETRITALAQAMGADIKALQAVGGGGGATDVDGNAVKLQIKSLTRAQIEAAATGGTLSEREPYLITDEGRLAVGTGTGVFVAMATLAEMEAFANVPIRTPTNVTPLNMATNVSHENLVLTGSPYNSVRGNEMAALHVQVSDTPQFIAKFVDTGDIQGTSTSYTVPYRALPGMTSVYWRVRYKDSTGEYSAWSAYTKFDTAFLYDYIATPTLTPSTFGAPLEGGFYAGLIWNELEQSTTSMAIGTGSKTFTVPNMSATPIVYAGQSLEIRSRANPANKMIGVVTNAGGTTLIMNITSIGGSGVFADWSIMSQYRVIVPPKASGENAAIAIKNANTALPLACRTLTEGKRATEAMYLAGTSTVYPAAHWARTLTIGGKTDWYIPSREELELCIRNLKPDTAANYVGGDRAKSAYDYGQNGSYADLSVNQGNNNNSSPPGTAYLSNSPTQTTATVFRTGGAEAYTLGSVRYWTATEYDTSFSWVQWTGGSGYGAQGADAKTSGHRIRAVRRSII